MNYMTTPFAVHQCISPSYIRVFSFFCSMSTIFFLAFFFPRKGPFLGVSFCCQENDQLAHEAQEAGAELEKPTSPDFSSVPRVPSALGGFHSRPAIWAISKETMMGFISP